MLVEKSKEKKEKEKKKLINEAWCPTCGKKVVLTEANQCPVCGAGALKKILNG